MRQLSVVLYGALRSVWQHPGRIQDVWLWDDEGPYTACRDTEIASLREAAGMVNSASKRRQFSVALYGALRSVGQPPGRIQDVWPWDDEEPYTACRDTEVASLREAACRVKFSLEEASTFSSPIRSLA